VKHSARCGHGKQNGAGSFVLRTSRARSASVLNPHGNGSRIFCVASIPSGMSSVVNSRFWNAVQTSSIGFPVPNSRNNGRHGSGALRRRCPARACPMRGERSVTST
jgi:hypothetical protein